MDQAAKAGAVETVRRPGGVQMPLRTFSNAPKVTEDTLVDPASVPAVQDGIRTPPSLPMPSRTEPASQGLGLTNLEDGSYYAVLDARTIDANSNPPRQIYTQENIQALYDSMRVNGQRDAIHVIPHPSKPGRYIIGDGWTRIQGIISHDLFGSKVQALVHPNLTEEQASWLGYRQNEDRSPPSDYDRAIFYSGWRNQGMTWEKIASKAGVSPALMSYYGAFLKFPSELSVFTKEHSKRITANAAHHLARLFDSAGVDAALSLARRFIEEDHPIKWLKDHVDHLIASLDKKGTPPRKSTAQVMFQRRYAAGHYRQRRNGQIEMTMLIPEDRVDEFNLAMESLLKEFVDTAPQLAESPADDGHNPAS